MEGYVESESGLIVPQGVIEPGLKDPEKGLTRHAESLTKLSAVYPKLIRHGLDLAGQIVQYANDNEIALKDIVFGVVNWHTDGTIVFEIGKGVQDAVPGGHKQILEHAESLMQLDEKFPQIVTLIFSLALRLTNYVNTKRIRPKDLEFSRIKWNRDGHIVFKITHAGFPLRPMDVNLS